MEKSNKNCSFERVLDLTIWKYFRHKTFSSESIFTTLNTPCTPWIKGKYLTGNIKTTTGERQSSWLLEPGPPRPSWSEIHFFSPELRVFTERDKQLFLQRQTWKSRFTKSQVLQHEAVQRNDKNSPKSDREKPRACFYLNPWASKNQSCDLILDEWVCASVLLRRPFYLASLCPLLITCGLPLESFIIRPELKTVITVCQVQRGEQWLILYKRSNFQLAPQNNLRTLPARLYKSTKGCTCPLGWPAKL